MNKKRKKQDPFAWPFSRNRQCWIAEADRMIANAAELLDDPAVGPFLPSQFARYRRAAKIYERSADTYRRAGLGLMAQGSWQDAAECWSMIGDQEQCHRCETQAANTPVYYDGEGA